MGQVIVLPGFMGSELKLNASTGPLHWADQDSLWKLGLDPMLLDGTLTGQPPAGTPECVPGGPLQDYYQQGMTQLVESLAGTAFASPTAYGYDWRQSLVKIATSFTAIVRAYHAQSGPVTLVGHSQGGLIARLVHYQMSVDGDDAKIRRIICLGTPHKGSWEIVKMWAGKSDTGQLFAILKGLKNINNPIAFLLDSQEARIAALVTITRSWPSLYEMLPQQTGTAEYNLQVRALYASKTWTVGNGLYPVLINNAVNETMVRLQHPRSVPQGRKLVCVVGKGSPTPYLVNSTDYFRVDPIGNMDSTDQGDGVVTIDSARVPSADLVYVEQRHSVLFGHVCAYGILAGLIKEDFAGTIDVPAPVKVDKAPMADEQAQPPPFRKIDFPKAKKRGHPKH